MKDKIFKNLVYLCTIYSIVMIIVLVTFIIGESYSFFKENSIVSFVLGDKWSALEGFKSFGIFNILMASIFVSILACTISLPLALGGSLFIAFYSRKKKILRWSIDILAGIPSIVYGFFGLFCIVKVLEKTLKVSSGESLLAGGILLSIMILPYFVSSILDTIENQINLYQRDSLSLGISKEFFIRNIIIKKTMTSMFSSFIVAFSRAIGETMAIMMVIGNTPIFPKLLSKIQTIPSLIALEVGMSEVGSLHYSALFASGLVLLIIVFVINILLFLMDKKRRDIEKI